MGPQPRPPGRARVGRRTSTFCADSFELAGGAIRSAAVTAAYLAADAGGVMTMRHLVTAVQREYRKLGRLCLESEFGRYWPLLA